MRSPAMLLLLATAGCSFKVAGIGAPRGSHPDLSQPQVVPFDMAVSDARIINDVFDMRMQPPDMSPGLQLSHVPQHFLADGTCDLTVATSISTSAPLQIDGGGAPSG